MKSLFSRQANICIELYERKILIRSYIKGKYIELYRVYLVFVEPILADLV